MTKISLLIFLKEKPLLSPAQNIQHGSLLSTFWYKSLKVMIAAGKKLQPANHETLLWADLSPLRAPA